MSDENSLVSVIVFDPSQGRVERVKLDTTKTLEELYRLIGCESVEVLSVGCFKRETGVEQIDAWFDEEARLTLPSSGRAGAIWNFPGGAYGQGGVYDLIGRVVFTGSTGLDIAALPVALTIIECWLERTTVFYPVGGSRLVRRWDGD